METSQFQLKENLPKINNLPLYRDLALTAESSMYFEGTGEEASGTMKPLYPEQIQGLKILLEYNGENRRTYFTELTLKENELLITNFDRRPEEY
jgi:hypothetical protein